MEEAQFYKKLKNNETQCELCHHFCRIQAEQTGVCGIRKNKKGELYSLNFGLPIAQNIDPIEKKPLFHFQPGSITYSLGTLGCNFRCKNCQNWEISQIKDINIEKEIKKLELVLPQEIVKEALGKECQSISCTYNEPTVFTEYALEIMKLARENGLKNVWVSNGYMSENCLGAILPFLDAINIDLKSMDEDFYIKNCGAELNPILENLKILKQEEIHLEIATLIIPSLSDDKNMLKKMANFIVAELGDETPWHLSKFSPQISWQLKDLKETPEEDIHEACDIGKKSGLKYVYVGNLPRDAKENTYCPECEELAIRRLGYYIERFDNEGLCAKCGGDLNIIA